MKHHRYISLLPKQFFGADGGSNDDDKDDKDDKSQEDKNRIGSQSDDGTDDGVKVENKYSQEYVDKLRSEAAKSRVGKRESGEELVAVKAELAKLKQAEMSDLEKANTQLEESVTGFEAEKVARVAAETSLKTERIQNAVTMAALDAGFVDPTDALSMISQDDLVDDIGTISVKTVKARLKVLADKKPYLLKKHRPGSSDGGSLNKPGDADTFEAKQAGYLKQMTEAGGRVVVGS